MEVFRKGAHVRGPNGEKRKLKGPVTIAACASSVNGWHVGDTILVKPRGSPNIWKVYQLRGDVAFGEPTLIFQHTDEDAALAWAALTQ